MLFRSLPTTRAHHLEATPKTMHNYLIDAARKVTKLAYCTTLVNRPPHDVAKHLHSSAWSPSYFAHAKIILAAIFRRGGHIRKRGRKYIYMQNTSTPLAKTGPRVSPPRRQLSSSKLETRVIESAHDESTTSPILVLLFSYAYTYLSDGPSSIQSKSSIHTSHILPFATERHREIGRASCRERV